MNCLFSFVHTSGIPVNMKTICLVELAPGSIFTIMSVYLMPGYE